MRWILVFFFVVACRTTSSGADERTAALLRDYAARPSKTWPEATSSDTPAWSPGQYTVHVRSRGERQVLERVVVRRRSGERVVVGLERLAPDETMKATLTLSSPPAASQALAIEEAWVSRNEGPEIHFTGALPAALAGLVASALAPPLDGTSGTLTVPAGRFEGCVRGTHAAVPLTGVVLQAADGETRALVEFGDDGTGALF